MHEGTEEVDAVRGLKFVKEGVGEEAGGVEVFEPSTPSQVALGVCAVFNSSCLGLLSMSEVSHDTLPAVRGYMVKEAGT
jgi:hypothetical protein